jgi:uncharacterized membrane protein
MNPLKTIKGTIGAGVALAIVIAVLFMVLQPRPAGISAVNAQSLIAWLHVLAGITWIGLLYYFNFVQVPALAAAAADQGGPGGAGISKYVAPRALLWFRWGAVFTWLTGAAYLAHVNLFMQAFTLSGAGRGIGIGAWLGTIMLINVWVFIWPNQKKVLGLVEATADQIAKARRVAFLASRANTVLSIPMLMSMVSLGHGGFFVR